MSNTLQSDDGGYEHDRRDIRLPNHTSVVSHVAADIGGSLAKVVYFSREVGRRPSGLAGAVDDAPAEDVRGGRLHFLRFETERIDQCIEFMRELQCKQRQGWAEAKEGKKSKEKEPALCVMATGGGAFKYYDRIKERLGVDVIREDEMSCLIQGEFDWHGRKDNMLIDFVQASTSSLLRFPTKSSRTTTKTKKSRFTTAQSSRKPPSTLTSSSTSAPESR